MPLELKRPELQELKPRITVIGVGGAGGNAVNNMIKAGLPGVDFVVANTDAQALTGSAAENRIQLGLKITQGLGAGSRPEIGRAAAEETLDQIDIALDGSHMCFITAGMGGGTGTGAAPIFAKAAREKGILTVAVVTKPFAFEGGRRMKLADEGIAELQKHVDTLIIIPNQNLFRIATPDLSLVGAFGKADEVLHSGVRSITDLMVIDGLINLDFADVRTVMSEMGKAMMGTGEAEGPTRAIDAAQAAIANPLLDEVSLRGAKGVIINITGGSDLTLFEVDEAANHIREMVDPDANIIVGSAFNEELNGRMRVAVVATGIEQTGTAAVTPSLNRAAPAVSSSPFGAVAGSFHSGAAKPIAAPEPAPVTAAAASATPEDVLPLTNDDMVYPLEAETPVAPTIATPEPVVSLPTPPLVDPVERPLVAARPAPRPAAAEPPRTLSLFERITSRKAVAAKPAGAAPELDGITREDRPAASGTGDPFEIPTFLRRQSN
jgi:cell division protein FtsZ